VDIHSINRWQGIDTTDMKSHIPFYSGKERGTPEFGVAFVVEWSIKFYKCACSYRGKG
jgi:hypothetical protein